MNLARDESNGATFAPINPAYNRVFRPGRLSLGLVAPLEAYASGATPTMHRHAARAELAETLGFSALWLRDVVFDVPSFGDAGQLYDPFPYLGFLAGRTERIALGVASVVVSLRHPAYVAKSAASVDVLSEGRLILGIASGDRPEEYPALRASYADRGARFRDAYTYIRNVGAQARPDFENALGEVRAGMRILPAPPHGRIPLLVTGGSQQDADWLAQNGDGWMVYPRPIALQAHIIDEWRTRIKKVGRDDQPVMQPLYLDLADDPDAPPQPIHLGLRVGLHGLRRYLKQLEAVGVNHVALNLRFNQADIEATMRTLADALLPDFSGS